MRKRLCAKREAKRLPYTLFPLLFVGEAFRLPHPRFAKINAQTRRGDLRTPRNPRCINTKPHCLREWRCAARALREAPLHKIANSHIVCGRPQICRGGGSPPASAICKKTTHKFSNQHSKNLQKVLGGGAGEAFATAVGASTYSPTASTVL